MDCATFIVVHDANFCLPVRVWLPWGAECTGTSTVSAATAATGGRRYCHHRHRHRHHRTPPRACVAAGAPLTGPSPHPTLPGRCVVAEVVMEAPAPEPEEPVYVRELLPGVTAKGLGL